MPLGPRWAPRPTHGVAPRLHSRARRRDTQRCYRDSALRACRARHYLHWRAQLMPMPRLYDARFLVRLTAEEHRTLKRLARAASLSQSRLVASLLVDADTALRRP